MNKRMANVENIRINSLSYSSLFEIGDANRATPVTKTIAVQKKGGISSEEGFEFEDFKIFEQETPVAPDIEAIAQNHTHHYPHIHVKNVDITGVSSSSIIQIGSLNHIDATSRIKHIRISEDEQYNNN